MSAPFTDGGTVALGDPVTGYLCDFDLERPSVVRYSFESSGEALDGYLLPHDDLEAFLDGGDPDTCISLAGLDEFELGPFRLSTGRYALVVEAVAEAADVEVTYTVELLREG